MTPAELDELAALEAKATPGEWCKPFDDGAIAVDTGDSLLAIDKDGMAIVDKPADAALIVAARNALPKLLAMARESLAKRVQPSRGMSELLELRAERDALAGENESWRKLNNRDGDKILALMSEPSEVDSLRAEVARLRAALEEIANDDLSDPLDASQLRDIARDALEGEGK